MLSAASAMSPSTVNSIVDAFFDVKKSEMKQQVALEMDRVIEDLFGHLVGQVKQFLIPQSQVVPLNSNVSTNPTESTSSPPPVSMTNGKFQVPMGNPGPKYPAVKSLSHSSGHNQNDTSVKTILPSVTSDVTTNRAKESSQSKSSTIKDSTDDAKMDNKQMKPNKRLRIDSSGVKDQVTQLNKSIDAVPTNTSETPLQSTSLVVTQRNLFYAVKSLSTPSTSVKPSFTPMVIKKEFDCDQKQSDENIANKSRLTAVKRDLSQEKADNRDSISKELKSPRKVQCTTPGCERTFRDKWNMQSHQRSHSSLKPFICRWPGCTYASGNRSHAIRHIRGTHFKRSAKQGEEARMHQWDPKVYLHVDKHLLT